MALAIHLNTTDQTFDAAPTLAEFPPRLTRLEEFAQKRYRAAREPSAVRESQADPSKAAGAAPSQRS